MAENDGTIANIELWDGSSWTLRGWPAIRRWSQKIEDFWRPFESANVPSDPVNVRGHVFGRLNEALNRLAQAESSGVTPRDFAPDLANLLNQPWGPCHPDSSIGQIMGDLSEEFSVEAALFAYAITRGHAQPVHAQNLEHTRGMLAAAFPGWSGVAGSHKRLANERTSFRNAVVRLSDTMDRAEMSRKDQWTDLLQQSTVGMVGWARRRSNAWRDTKSRWTSHRNEMVNQLDTLEQTYREKLALMAPVQYWNLKATNHKAAEKWARRFVVAFFVLALPSLVTMFGGASWYLLQNVDRATPPGLYIIASAGLATTAGVMFWIGRLLTKLYLSQHHLRQDAEERAVMTTTYLAFTAERAADDADRAIILNALFRPTSDGIVKEDGGLDMNLASLLSRVATRP